MLDLSKASHRLSELDLKISTDHLNIDVLWFRVMQNQGNWIISRHTHSSYEFHFVASGASKVILDDREFEVFVGQFYLTAPGVYHEQQGIGVEDYVEYSMNCDIMALDDSLSEEQNVLGILKDCPCKAYLDSVGIMDLFEQALYEACYQHLGFYTQIKNVVVLMIMRAARVMNENTPITYQVPHKNKKYDYRYLQIEKFIKDNITDNISTLDIANYMYLSDKQICRIVKEKKGMSTKELINFIKLKKAKELLKETHYSVKQISEILAFSSQYYFNQFFKNQEGYPPGEFRKNIRDVQ